MRIGFLLYPTASVKVDEDSSFWIMHELCLRGHKVFHFESKDLFSEHGKTKAYLYSSVLDPRRGFTSTKRLSEPAAMDTLDVIFIRKEPPFDNEYLYALQLLSLSSKGAFLLNDQEGIASCNEKLFILKFPQWIPDSFVSSRPNEIKKFIYALKTKAVLKPLNNKGGAGIVQTHAQDRNLPSLLDQATQNGYSKIMVQRYIPHDKAGDKRILLLNGDFLGCFIRRPSKHDFRANLSVGGKMSRAILSAKDRKMIETLKPELIRHGLYFVGIDVISGYLSEINVTSPSGIPEIRQLTGQKLEKKVADFIEKLGHR